MVFTDYMYKYDVYLSKAKDIVLVTDDSIYVLHIPSYQVINHIKLSNLKKILTIQTNSSIFALSFNGDNIDLLFESYRRTEFIIFLLQNCDNS